MRSHAILALVAFMLATLAFAWEREDHDIFRLNDEVKSHEGSNVTFYSFLGVDPSATREEISKVHRKRSVQMHPDKVVPSILARRSMPQKNKKDGKKTPVVKKGPTQKEREQVTREATERYQRLGDVAGILKSPARERYDHFLANGFPMWRGTGYYYARFRPGLFSVLFGLFVVFGGVVHYIAMYVGWRKHRDFVERYIERARKMAWGNEAGIPGLSNAMNGGTNVPPPPPPPELEADTGMALNRRQKRLQEKENRKKDSKASAKSARNNGISRPVEAEPISQAPTGARKKVVAENGKILIVDVEGNVFLEETTEEGETHELLLDPNEIPQPTIFQTAVFRLPVWAYSRTVGRVLGSKAGVSETEPLLENEHLVMNDADQRAEKAIDDATAMNANAETRKRRAMQKGKNK